MRLEYFAVGSRFQEQLPLQVYDGPVGQNSTLLLETLKPIHRNKIAVT